MNMCSYRGGVNCRAYDGAIVVPRTGKRKRMNELGLFFGGVQVPWSNSDIVCNPSERKEPVTFDTGKLTIREIDEEVIFIGTLWCMWGHLITDFAAHLWPVLSLDRKLRVAYAVGSPVQTLPNNFKGLLAALGVPPDRLIEVRESTRFRKVHFGEPSFWHVRGEGVRWTEEYERTIDAAIAGVLGDSRPTPHRKIYLTRTGFLENRKDFGEKTIETAYRRAGFEIVAPEKISFEKMVRLLAETEVLAATEGSVSHNALFLPRGARIEILRKYDCANEYQEGINRMRGLKSLVFDVSDGNMLAVPKEPFRGPFLLGVTPPLAVHLGCAPVRASRSERLKCLLCRVKLFIKAHRI